MRCPACGAHNADGAAWCGQCYTRFDEPAPPADAATASAAPASPADEAVLPPEVAPPTSPAAPPAVGAQRTTSAGDFRKTEHGVEWRCQVCGDWTPIDAPNCGVCQTPFARSVAHAEGGDDRPRPVDLNVAVIATGVLPGTGHYLMGYVADGVSRAITYLFTLVGGLLLLREGSTAGGSTLPGVMLLSSAAVVFAVTIYDTLLARSGRAEDQLLTGRRFFYFIVATLGLLMFSFVVAAVSVRSAATG